MAACGIAPEDDDGNSATKAPPPKAVPKAPPVIPKQMGATSNQWQLKASAEPDTSPEDWAVTIAEATNFALEMAQSVDNVNEIYKINKNIFNKLKEVDSVTYSMLLDQFKQAKEKLQEKADEYVPE